MTWHTINTAPPGCDLELAVIDDQGEHALSFPCRKASGAWISARTRQLIDVHPTHWREWRAAA